MPEMNPTPARHDPARAAAPAAAPEAKDKADPVVATLVKSVQQLEERTRAAGPATAKADLDVAPAGGRYKVKGKLVNAHGRELNDDGSLKHPEQQQVDAFGRLV
jgi:hypothetical protein